MDSMTRARVLVSNLDDSTTTQYIAALLEPFGPIVDVAPGLDTNGKFRGYAEVQFETEEDARAAIDNMEGASVFGRILHVRQAKKAAPQIDTKKAVWEQSLHDEEPSAMDET